MKTLSIVGCFGRIGRRIKARRQTEKMVSNALTVTQPVMEAVVARTKEKYGLDGALVANSFIHQLANIKYHDWKTDQDINVYDKVTLSYIYELYNISPEKALDMANRIIAQAKAQDYQNLPRDWDYVMNVYKNDYSFITGKLNPDTSLSKLEAMHHVKEEIADEKAYTKYWHLSPALVYSLLEIRKEYPEQADEILNNSQYKNLFVLKDDSVPDMKDMKEFAEFIKDDSETMKKTLNIFTNSKRYSPEHSNSYCTLSDALKYAKMMKENPEATTKIMSDLIFAEPELVKFLIAYSDNPNVLEDFRIYSHFIQPVKMYDQEYSNREMKVFANDHGRNHMFSIPVDKAVLDDLGKFLKSDFLGRLDNILAEKFSSADNKENSRYQYFLYKYERTSTDEAKKHKFNLEGLLDAIIGHSVPRNKLIKTDRETFLRLVKDDILFYKVIYFNDIIEYNAQEMDTIIKLYQKYPNREISRETINKYLKMDKAVADAFLE